MRRSWKRSGIGVDVPDEEATDKVPGLRPPAEAAPVKPEEPAPKAEGAPAYDVAGRAVQGLLWAALFGWGSRVVSLCATVVLTFFLDRSVLGEVSTAAILVASLSQLSMLGVPTYLSIRKELSEDTRWTAVVLLGAVGVIAGLLALALGAPVGRKLGVPLLAEYVPWLAAAAFVTRISTVPEVLLQRSMRFREASACKAAGDVLYAVVVVALAAMGSGGKAVVYGHLARSLAVLLLLSARLSPRVWLAPAALSRASARSILGFGLPITVGLAGNIVVRQWDNLLVLWQFGPGAVGAYNQAYNLADVPAVQVTEQLGDVMAPSFAKLDLERKKAAIVRLLAALSVVVYPLAAGLAVTSPTFVSLLRAEWAPMAPLLTILALLAMSRPIGWTLGVYFQTTGRPRTVMWLMLVLVVVLFPTMFLLGRALGPEGACAGVVVAFGVHALASMAVIAS